MARSALVTGGTGGLGVAVTTAFLDAGWRVVVPWVVERELTRMPKHPRLKLVRADLFDEKSALECAAAAASNADAPLRAVVNLVGGFAAGGRVHETPIDEFENQLLLNLRATYLTCHATLPYLVQSGGGSIVCMSSRAAKRPFAGAAGYVTSKAGILALVDALNVEYADAGVRANAVLPGVIDTPANREAMPDSDRRDWVAPADIARTILFLAGTESSTISGAHIPVDRA
ncbi:SDR family NAD(P)-dependent oxidoreductase [Actinophytocola gossypii]|uniref:SDR family oxidoreductase n=1 Tax=Actinophytocola gossypii TaxID=2812003 RepID=A0ABT2JK13_9PSEU|nr:SDR family oxidoreductase [Actinophytocola gossypii]MCT2588106.1 SDR family oxidoreductase [Actinophytocola gossypii]